MAGISCPNCDNEFFPEKPAELVSCPFCLTRVIPEADATDDDYAGYEGAPRNNLPPPGGRATDYRSQGDLSELENLSLEQLCEWDILELPDIEDHLDGFRSQREYRDETFSVLDYLLEVSALSQEQLDWVKEVATNGVEDDELGSRPPPEFYDSATIPEGTPRDRRKPEVEPAIQSEASPREFEAPVQKSELTTLAELSRRFDIPVKELMIWVVTGCPHVKGSMGQLLFTPEKVDAWVQETGVVSEREQRRRRLFLRGACAGLLLVFASLVTRYRVPIFDFTSDILIGEGELDASSRRTVAELETMSQAEEVDLPRLDRALAHREARVRQAAIKTLLRGRSDRAKEGRGVELGSQLTSSLIGTLEDKNPELRCGAAEVLRSYRPSTPGVTNSLAARLRRDDVAAVRKIAAEAIGAYRTAAKETVPALIESLNDEDREVQREVALALVQVDAKSADPGRPQLLEALAQGDESQRTRAAAALGQLSRDKSAVLALSQALGDSDALVRHAAADSLGRYGEFAGSAADALRKALKDAEPEVRGAAAAALGGLGAPAASSIPELTALAQRDQSAVRDKATHALSRLALHIEPAISALLSLLVDENADSRRRAAVALGGAARSNSKGIEAALKPLFGALEDESQFVRGSAAQALGSLGQCAVPGLVSRLGDSRPRVRRLAAIALAEAGRRLQPGSPLRQHAARSLASALDDTLRVRQALVIALGVVGEDALTVLSQQLKSPRVEIRLDVLDICQKLGKGCVPMQDALVSALADADPRVGAAAVRVFDTVTENADPRLGRRLVRGLEESGVAGRLRIVSALRELGVGARDALIEGIDSRDEKLRYRVISLLGELGPKAHPATPHLIKALGDEVDRVRFWASNTLSDIGEPAVDPLIEALDSSNPHVRALACRALGRIGSPPRKIKNALKPLRQDATKVVQAAALEALRKLRDSD